MTERTKEEVEREETMERRRSLLKCAHSCQTQCVSSGFINIKPPLDWTGPHTRSHQTHLIRTLVKPFPIDALNQFLQFSTASCGVELRSFEEREMVLQGAQYAMKAQFGFSVGSPLLRETVTCSLFHILTHEGGEERCVSVCGSVASEGRPAGSVQLSDHRPQKEREKGR